MLFGCVAPGILSSLVMLIGQYIYHGQVHDGDLLAVDWRPPPGSDGTPNESIADVLVRLRQVCALRHAHRAAVCVDAVI